VNAATVTKDNFCMWLKMCLLQFWAPVAKRGFHADWPHFT